MKNDDKKPLQDEFSKTTESFWPTPNFMAFIFVLSALGAAKYALSDDTIEQPQAQSVIATQPVHSVPSPEVP